MKRILSVLLVSVLLLVSASAFSVSAAELTYGDLDENGRINNKDLGLLQQHLNEYGVTINVAAADVNNDGRINNKDLGLMQQFLNEWDVTLGPDNPEDPDNPDNPDIPDVPDVPAAELPAVGYDIDGRGRILVEAISQEGYVVTVTLTNKSSKWMTEETSCVQYTCTDAAGDVLATDDKYFGTLYFGMLEANETDTFTITLPEGTTKLEFGDYRIVYWSQWA